jgi:heptosyltransferase-2
LGGKGEAENASKITSALGSIIYNACGNYAINQSASLVKQSQKIITHDTGLMHIAAAFQKPIVSVWGNTIPEFGMAPYYGSSGTDNPAVKSSIMEVKNLTCRPCSKIGYEKCPKGHFKCMKEIDDREIVLALERV